MKSVKDTDITKEYIWYKSGNEDKDNFVRLVVLGESRGTVTQYRMILVRDGDGKIFEIADIEGRVYRAP